MTHYQKGMLVMNYLRDLKVEMIAIARAVDDRKLEQSYKLITENPKISKREFLERMQISED